MHRGFVSGPEGSDSRGEQEEGQASAIALCCRKKGRVLGDVAPRDTTWRREAKEMEEESRGEAGGMRRDRRRSEREEADEREKRGDQEGGETTEEGAPPQDEGGTGGGLAPRGLVGTQEDEAETPESDGAGPSWEPIVHAGSLGPVSPSPVLHVVRADGKDPSSPHRKAAQGDPRTPSMAAPPKAQPAESPADWKGAGGAITARGIAFGDEDEQKERAPVEVVQFLPAIVTRGSKRPRFRHQVAGLVAMRGYGRNSPRGGECWSPYPHDCTSHCPAF